MDKSIWKRFFRNLDDATLEEVTDLLMAEMNNRMLQQMMINEKTSEKNIDFTESVVNSTP